VLLTIVSNLYMSALEQADCEIRGALHFLIAG
jgi:hypothetical protein